MRDTFIIALEAAWELDPVLLDEALWKAVDEEKIFDKYSTLLFSENSTLA